MSAHVFAQLVILVLSVRLITHVKPINVKMELPHNQTVMCVHAYAQLDTLDHSVKHLLTHVLHNHVQMVELVKIMVRHTFALVHQVIPEINVK